MVIGEWSVHVAENAGVVFEFFFGRETYWVGPVDGGGKRNAGGFGNGGHD